MTAGVTGTHVSTRGGALPSGLGLLFPHTWPLTACSWDGGLEPKAVCWAQLWCLPDLEPKRG